MGKLATAERVSRDASDNFVFQRSLLAYDRAAEIVSGDVLEIGTGTGYGIELVAPHCDRFVTVDKYAAAGDRHAANVEFRRMCVPPLGFGDESFDFVITFQVIEHIDDDAAFVREIARVLRPGGRMILTTPNAPMSLTRNPWHVADAFCAAEGRSVLFGFTDRVAPVLVLFASGLGVFTAGTAFLTFSGRTRVCVCQKSLPVR